MREFASILRVRKALQEVISYLLVVTSLVFIMLLIALW